MDLTRRASPSGLPTGAFHPPLDPRPGGLRARPGPPDRGRLRAPSGHPSTRLSPPWTAPKGVAPLNPLPLLSVPPARGCKPAVNSTGGIMDSARGGLMASRSGSEKRQRTTIVTMRISPQEAVAIRQLAQKHGETVSGLMRSALLHNRPRVARVRPAGPRPAANRLRIAHGRSQQSRLELQPVRSGGQPGPRTPRGQLCRGMGCIQGDVRARHGRTADRLPSGAR